MYSSIFILMFSVFIINILSFPIISESYGKIVSLVSSLPVITLLYLYVFHRIIIELEKSPPFSAIEINIREQLTY